jgi:ElaB/YqjD/DUF883 family membrane-anchored ribosome-binding protein
MDERLGTPSTPGAQGVSSAQEQHAPAQEAGQERRHHVQELTTQGKDVASQAMAQGREVVRMWQTQLDQQVREKPLQSLLMAAGIGLLFGLLRRR